MRQRRVKNREAILEETKNYIYELVPLDESSYDKHTLELSDVTSGTLAGVQTLSEEFLHNAKTYLEIGSGKGQFITALALRNPDKFYLACEGGLNINVRILQKAAELELNNLKVITEYLTEPTKYFAPGSIAGIYINFCDPWPKDRHANRRLTYRNLLEQYKIIAQGGFLEFKTDNDELFDWSMGEFEAAGLLPALELSRDLWHSEYQEKNIPTEYETKFASAGKTINYIKLNL